MRKNNGSKVEARVEAGLDCLAGGRSLAPCLPCHHSHPPSQPPTASSSLPSTSIMPAAKRGAAGGEPGKPAKQRKATQVATQAGPTSFEHFEKLPRELRTRIITLACCSPATDNAKSVSPITSTDLSTSLSIALVSREHYALAVPIIYAHVRLERPSRLQLLQRTLAARPALGRLITSLHIGPDDELPRWWWPIDKGTPPARRSLDDILYCRDILFLRSGLRGRPEDEALLPVWHKPDRQWSLNRANNDCRASAVFSATAAAARALDVALGNAGRDGFSGDIGLVSMYEQL